MKKMKCLKNDWEKSGFLDGLKTIEDKNNVSNYFDQTFEWCERNDTTDEFDTIVYPAVRRIYNLIIENEKLKVLEIFDVNNICRKLDNFIINEMPILDKYLIDCQKIFDKQIISNKTDNQAMLLCCLLYTSPSPRD